jgi:hypothetical protein
LLQKRHLKKHYTIAAAVMAAMVVLLLLLSLFFPHFTGNGKPSSSTEIALDGKPNRFHILDNRLVIEVWFEDQKANMTLVIQNQLGERIADIVLRGDPRTPDELTVYAGESGVGTHPNFASSQLPVLTWNAMTFAVESDYIVVRAGNKVHLAKRFDSTGCFPVQLVVNGSGTRLRQPSTESF